MTHILGCDRHPFQSLNVQEETDWHTNVHCRYRTMNTESSKDARARARLGGNRLRMAKDRGEDILRKPLGMLGSG